MENKLGKKREEKKILRSGRRNFFREASVREQKAAIREHGEHGYLLAIEKSLEQEVVKQEAAKKAGNWN